MNKKFYITTPIYYVNDRPHIGHAYTTLAADICARFHRAMGDSVFFLTGTDEHGQKVEKAALERGLLPKEHADRMVENFRKLWVRLNISSDGFIRTTDTEHVKTVQGLLQMLWDRGKIEKRSYAGWYCTPDERFWTEKDLIEGTCPDCRRPVDHIEEENYFFLMSAYQDDLIRHIEENPVYILPETRRNEVLGFLRNSPLGDLCISRPKQRLSWGIPLPFDDGYVTYVWFDALVNYFSATRYLAPGADKARQGDFWWPASHHLIGKDILTTHAVYWSAMLMALNLPLPGNIFAHGWWTVDSKKMSKSVGNVVDPHAIIDEYGTDAFRYFLFREVPFGGDGDFSEKALVNRINTDLANDLGNLLSRFLTMTEKYCGGAVEQRAPGAAVRHAAEELRSLCATASAEALRDEYWSHLRFNIILDRIWDVIRAANNYIARTEPWKLSREDMDSVRGVLSDVWTALRYSAVLISPFMPETAENIWRQIGLQSVSRETVATLPLTEEPVDARPKILEWDWRPDYAVRVARGEQLFPRIERKEAPQPAVGKAAPAPAASSGAAGTNLLAIGDFAKVELKIGRVLEAERVQNSNKLIRLRVDTGEERQIVAGIGKAYTPEALLGRKIVVVTNLQPARLMGVESQGMLLATTGPDGVPVILVPERDVPEGSKIK